ncbi:MAG: HAMP domain-containing histidine kinase [Gemmatimonadaceae bacterium]|nr:HAMP domain-containing histidine kinase [Gloeobacterales cyanobacterium ES-bin-141]
MFLQTRLRLLASFLGVLCLILTVFAVAVFTFFEWSLSERFDRQLATFARAVLSSVDIEEGRLDFRGMPRVSPGGLSDTEVQWFDPGGGLLRQMGALADILPPLKDLPTDGTFSSQTGLRIWTQPVHDPVGGGRIGYLRVARSLASIESNRRQLLSGLLAGIPVTLALSALGGWGLTGLVIRPVESSFARLEQFTADASHELRSPLMAIQSNCAVALKYPEGIRPGDRQKFLLVEDATRQLVTLVQELLMLARAREVGTVQAVALTNLVASVVAEYTPQAQERGLKLECHTAEHTNPQVVGKPVQLRCLVGNLLENAIKYTPAGGRVDVTLSLKGQSVILEVEDTGIGIAPDDLPHVFERFWQADHSRHYRQGSGLGLAIAYGIASAHGGRVTVESVLDRGSRFRVSLPGRDTEI